MFRAKDAAWSAVGKVTTSGSCGSAAHEAPVPKDYDQQALASILSDLQADDALAGTWYDEAALERLIGQIAEGAEGAGGGLLPGADPDAIPEAVETRCQTGDLWALGRHRLLCGDSTNAEDVGRLMGGERPKVLLTDPPYAVDYVEKARDMNRRGYVHSRAKSGAAIAGDGIEAGQEETLWRDAFTLARESLAENAAVYIWHAQGRAGTVLYNLLGELNFLHHQTIIWRKTNHLKAGELAYDPFCGSGTAIVAAEAEEVRCFGMEFSARHADTILARWEQATGQTAELLERR